MTLNAKKYRRQILLLCPTCGSDQFAHDSAETEGNAMHTCVNCGLEITKDDLIRANGENVHEHVKEITQEVTKDLGDHLRKSLKQAFRGNKNIRFK
jgi:uncharacterized Zn finger protein